MSMNNDALDNIFKRALSGTSIFKDRDVLRSEYIPPKLPFRDIQIASIGEVLSPVLHDSKCSNLLLYGKTGTGKTATAKYVLQRFQETAKNHNKVIKIAYSNARLAASEYRVLVDLGHSLNLKIPFTGLPISEVLQRVFNKIVSESMKIIFILDEIDYLTKHASDDILYSLTRSGEHIGNGFLSIIGISNDLQFKEFLDPRVLSSLGEEEIVFPPYTVEQLRAIIQERAKIAFNDGAVTEACINICAALAGTEHGDARRAVDLLRVAGEISEREGAKQVDEKHVRLALQKVDQDRIVEAIRLLPLHEKIVLIAVAKSDDIGSTGEVFEDYSDLCKKIKIDPLTQRRVSGLLNELDLLGLLTANIINKGRYGRTKKISSLVPLQTIQNIIKEDPSLNPLI